MPQRAVNLYDQARSPIGDLRPAIIVNDAANADVDIQTDGTGVVKANGSPLSVISGAATAKNIPVFTSTNTIADGATQTGPFYLRSSNGILAKFQDNGVVTNYPIFGAVASGALTIESSATNANINMKPNGSGVVNIGGGTGTMGVGTVNVNAQVKIGLGTSTWAGTTTPLLRIPQNHAGTLTGGARQNYNEITISSDDVDTTGLTNTVSVFAVSGNFGGTNFRGSRTGVFVSLDADGPAANGCALIGGAFWANAYTNCGGTNTNLGAVGNFYGLSLQGETGASGTNLYIVSGGEINTKLVAGSSTKIKAGLTIVQKTSDAVQGAHYDVGLGFSNQGAADIGSAYPVGWEFGIAFGRVDGIWPMDTTSGTIIGTYYSVQDNAMLKPFGGLACKYGVDFANVEFSTNAWRSTGFTVDGAGVTKIGPSTISPTTAGLTIDCNGQYVSAVAAIVSGGTGKVAGDRVYDGLGGVYDIATVAAGVVTALTIINKAYSVSPPGNPVTLTGGHGTDITVNLTWTASPALSLNLTGDTIVGKQSAKATTDTTGYMLIPFVSGTPTGVPTNASKGVAVVYDTSANKLWAYNGSWRSVTLA